VLNDETGHRSSETRRQIYQDRERDEVLAKSAATGPRVRQAVFGVPLVVEAAVEPAREAIGDAPQKSASHTPVDENGGGMCRAALGG
jgi:hypothetical protein